MAFKRNKSYHEILKSLVEDPLQNSYLIYGGEDFLREEAIKILCRRIVSPETQSLNRIILYGEDVLKEELVSQLTSFSIFGEKRVIIIKDVDRLNTATQKALTNYLYNTMDTTVCIGESSDSDIRKKKIFKVWKEKGVCLEFKPLYRNQLPVWLQREANSIEIKIAPEAVEILIENAGMSLRSLSGELKKLALFISPRTRIEKEDISAAVGDSQQYNIFAFFDALGDRNVQKVIHIVMRLIERGEKPTGIIYRLAGYWTKLLQIKLATSSEELAKKLSIHPYFLSKYKAQAARFSVEQLEYGYRYMLNADAALKQGVRDEKLIITILIYQLLQETPTRSLRLRLI